MFPAITQTGAWRRSKLLKAALGAAALFVLGACAATPTAAGPAQGGPALGGAPPRPAVRSVAMEAAGFDAVPGWRAINARPALEAFVRSCRRWDDKPDTDFLNPAAPYAGRVADWRGACVEAAMLMGLDPDPDAARAFFERHFTPLELRGSGRLTGYYEPYVDVRDTPDAEFSMAIRAAPGAAPHGEMERLLARLDGRRGLAERRSSDPARWSRAQIEARNIGTPLAWGRPIDVFFLQIQGSGRLVYPDGHSARVRFAAHNDRPYVSIGRLLVERGELSIHDASKQDIEAWLNRRGPAAWQALFDENPRYVFFSLDTLDDPSEGPLGAQGAPLTPMASMAVDARHHAWGVPVLVNADLPGAPDWRGLVIAQDAGGAIEGPVRGDLFYGWGHRAGEQAGRQNDPDARWTILLPKALAARVS